MWMNYGVGFHRQATDPLWGLVFCELCEMWNGIWLRMILTLNLPWPHPTISSSHGTQKILIWFWHRMCLDLIFNSFLDLWGLHALPLFASHIFEHSDIIVSNIYGLLYRFLTFNDPKLPRKLLYWDGTQQFYRGLLNLDLFLSKKISSNIIKGWQENIARSLLQRSTCKGV